MGASENAALCPCPSLPASCLKALRSVEWLLPAEPRLLLCSPFPMAAMPPPLASPLALLLPSTLPPLFLRDVGDPVTGEGADRGLCGDPRKATAAGRTLTISTSWPGALSNPRLSKLLCTCSSYLEEGDGMCVCARGVCVVCPLGGVACLSSC